MKNRIMLACLFFLPFSLFGADIADWIAVSDRRDNTVIASILRDSSFTEQIAIVHALGKRKDFYMSEIIDCLSGSRGIPELSRGDYLLRVLLVSVFPPAVQGEELRARLNANKEAFGKLVKDLGGIPDLQLRAEIVRLIPYSGRSSHLGVLMAEADLIVDLLSDRRLTSAEQDYILAYLLAVEKVGDAVFLEPCVRIYEQSAQARVSRTSESVIRVLKAAIESSTN
jgi:hypothetical protein